MREGLCWGGGKGGGISSQWLALREFGGIRSGQLSAFSFEGVEGLLGEVGVSCQQSAVSFRSVLARCSLPTKHSVVSFEGVKSFLWF